MTSGVVRTATSDSAVTCQVKHFRAEVHVPKGHCCVVNLTEPRGLASLMALRWRPTSTCTRSYGIHLKIFSVAKERTLKQRVSIQTFSIARIFPKQEQSVSDAAHQDTMTYPFVYVFVGASSLLLEIKVK